MFASSIASNDILSMLSSICIVVKKMHDANGGESMNLMNRFLAITCTPTAHGAMQ